MSDTKPGRPPSPEARERDDRILDELKKGDASVAELSERLDLGGSLAYISLCRLRDRGEPIEKKATGTRTPVWGVKTKKGKKT